jgi:hypothetical protein
LILLLIDLPANAPLIPPMIAPTTLPVPGATTVPIVAPAFAPAKLPMPVPAASSPMFLTEVRRFVCFFFRSRISRSVERPSVRKGF